MPYSSSATTVTKPLELIFSDVWGPSPILSHLDFHYYIQFLDVYSKFTWIFPMKAKSDALSIFIAFKANIEKLLGFKIITFQSGNGGEYLAFKSFMLNNGITHRFSCPYAHQQNGASEQKHRHIVDSGLTLLAHASLSKIFWLRPLLHLYIS